MTRELVYTGFMSLDGVVDSPGGTAEGHRSGGWVMETDFVPEAFALKGDELADTTALMFGRRSYEAFAPFWRDSDDHAAYKDFPKYVVSTTITDADLFDRWGPTTILRSSDDVASVKQGEGGAIFIHGSAELACRLADADLIDRYNLLLFPVLLGAGKSLFSRDSCASVNQRATPTA
jgi:dihydrofolate reductase